MSEAQHAMMPMSAQSTRRTAKGLGRSRKVSLALAAFASALFLAGYSRDGGSLSFRVLLGSLSVVLAAAAAATLAVPTQERKERSGVMFGYIFPIFAAFAYGVLSLRWIAEPTYLDQIQDRELIVQSFLLVVIGLVAWTVGYFLAGLRPTKHLARRVGSRFLPAYPPGLSLLRPGVLMLGIGLAAESALIARGEFGYLQQIDSITTSVDFLSSLLRPVAQLAILGIALLSLELFERSTIAVKVFLGVGVAIEGLLAAFSGGKEPFILIGLAITLSAAVAGKLSKRTVILWALLGILLIFPLNATYRSLLRPTPGVQATTSDSVDLLFVAIGETFEELLTDPSGYVQGAVLASSDRLRLIDPVAITVRAHDSGLQHSGLDAAFERVATILIPRPFWPQKPIDTYSLDVSRDYWGTPSFVISSSSLTFFGDGYRYLSTLGVVLGLCYCGFVMRFLDLAFDHRRNRFALAILLVLIPPVVKSELDIAALGVQIFRSLLIICPLLFLVSTVSPSSQWRTKATSANLS